MFPNTDVLTCRWGDDFRTVYHSEEPYCLGVNRRYMEQDALKWCKMLQATKELMVKQWEWRSWVSLLAMWTRNARVIQTHPRLKDHEFQCPWLWHTLSNLHMLIAARHSVKHWLYLRWYWWHSALQRWRFSRGHPGGTDTHLAGWFFWHSLWCVLR